MGADRQAGPVGTEQQHGHVGDRHAATHPRLAIHVWQPTAGWRAVTFLAPLGPTRHSSHPLTCHAHVTRHTTRHSTHPRAMHMLPGTRPRPGRAPTHVHGATGLNQVQLRPLLAIAGQQRGHAKRPHRPAAEPCAAWQQGGAAIAARRCRLSGSSRQPTGRAQRAASCPHGVWTRAAHATRSQLLAPRVPSTHQYMLKRCV